MMDQFKREIACYLCLRYGQRKLNHRYIEPFRFLERIGSVVYRLELPRDLERIHEVFHVSILRKYISNPSHVLEAPLDELKKNLSFEVQCSTRT